MPRQHYHLQAHGNHSRSRQPQPSCSALLTPPSEVTAIMSISSTSSLSHTQMDITHARLNRASLSKISMPFAGRFERHPCLRTGLES